jgi:hypothetical protein
MTQCFDLRCLFGIKQQLGTLDELGQVTIPKPDFSPKTYQTDIHLMQLYPIRKTLRLPTP